LYALDKDTREYIHLKGTLSDAEEKIIADNHDFFERLAVHVLADELLNSPEEAVSQQLKAKIRKKAQLFMQMMT
jgi:hypothetical protein